MACKQVLRWCAIVGACAWLVIGSAQSSFGGTITIDSFDLPDKGTVFILSPSGGSQWDHSDAVGDDSILGGERDVSIILSGAPGIDAIVAVGVIGVDLNATDNGMFTFGSQANSGSTVRLIYDGKAIQARGDQANLTGGLGSADLTDGGINTEFALRFAGSDGVVPEGLDVTIEAASSLGGTLTYSGYVPDYSDPSLPLVHKIPFADFTAIGGDASFDAIETLTFTFNGDQTPNVDFSLDLVATVPEPSSFAMLGLCLAVFAGHVVRSRRKKSPSDFNS